MQVWKAQIDSDIAERKKYIRVKNAISNHGLDKDISLKHFTKYIDECKDAIKKIDGNEGYHYLSTMKTKLQNDKDKIKEFTDFVRDANTSYKNLYSTLTAKIAALDSSISSNKSKYNKGKPFWEWIWWWKEKRMDTNINSIDSTYESSTVEYDDSNIAAIENELIEIANLFNSIDAEITSLKGLEKEWKGKAKDQYVELRTFLETYRADFLTISKILKQQFTVLRGFSLQFLHQQS